MYEIFLDVLGLVLTVILTVIANKIRQYYNLKITADESALFQNLARRAVLAVEQKMGRQHTDGIIGIQAFSAKDKRNAAISIFNQLAKSHGLSEPTIEIVDSAIEAAVGQMNHDGRK